MSKKLTAIVQTAARSSLLKNSFWGIASNILQNIFISLFFIILARKYAPAQFADFLVANTLYQVVAAFSAMGLGQWFIREYVHTEQTKDLTGRFLKIQFIFGVIFYFVNVLISFLLYDDYIIHMLSLVLGLNVLFDNVVYGIKHLNIAEFKQKKTFGILIIDAFLRLLAGCILFVEPLSVFVLSCILVVVRLVTVNLFLIVGSSSTVTIYSLLKYRISGGEVKKLIQENWTFIVIGSVSVIFWRLASMVVSKMLLDEDIANYEISFKIFSIAQVIPLIVSASVYPMLVKKYQEGGVTGLQQMYRWLFIAYATFGLLCYLFIYTFSGDLIPWVFGQKYPDNPVFTRQMFLTILVFPTALLQANIIVAIKQERMDMLFNIVALLLNLAGCIAGTYYFRSLSAVNYSIFFSFILFHLLQDFFLITKKITGIREVILVYGVMTGVVAGYIFLLGSINGYLLFTGCCMILALFFYFGLKKFRKAGIVSI